MKVNVIVVVDLGVIDDVRAGLAQSQHDIVDTAGSDTKSGERASHHRAHQGHGLRLRRQPHRHVDVHRSDRGDVIATQSPVVGSSSQGSGLKTRRRLDDGTSAILLYPVGGSAEQMTSFSIAATPRPFPPSRFVLRRSALLRCTAAWCGEAVQPRRMLAHGTSAGHQRSLARRGSGVDTTRTDHGRSRSVGRRDLRPRTSASCRTPRIGRTVGVRHR